MNNTPYCTTVIPEECLEYIRALLFCTNQNEPWAQLHIDLFYSNDDCIGMHCFHRCFGSKDFLPIDLDEKTEMKLDIALSKFALRAEQKNNGQQWNKARIDYQRGTPTLDINYKIDHDLTWLMTNTNPYTFLERNPDTTEFEIMLWAGLPEDHERPWLKTPTKSTGDVIIAPRERWL